MNTKHEIKFKSWLKEKKEEAQERGGREETVNTFSLVLCMVESIQEFERR